jgi:hypothetical protein
MTIEHDDVKSFHPTESVGYLLKKTHAQMQTCAEAILAPHGVSFVQWIALLRLGERPEFSELTRLLNQLRLSLQASNPADSEAVNP